MPRPRRSPDSLVSRLVAYVTPATLERIKAEALRDGVSVGALLDRVFDPTLKANFDFTGPLSAPEPKSTKILKGTVSYTTDDPATVPEWSPKPIIRVQPTRPHPGWRVDSLNRNVCTSCGGQKLIVQGKPCPGPKEAT